MIYIVLVILGLAAGSFVNALVWRLHEQQKKSGNKKNLSIIHGRSMCPHCRHQLMVKDLIPILSWLSLRAKCRYCRKKIDDSPLVELLTAGLFIFSYGFWPTDFTTTQTILFGIWLIFITGFMALAIYDLKWYLLPNQIIYPLIVLALIQVLGLFAGSGHSSVLSEAFFGVVVASGLFYLLFQISGGKWIGGGDVKLGVLLGAIIGGPLMSFLMLFLASFLGSLVSIPLLISGRAKRKSRLPFGPFLILATIIVRLFGISLIAWYKKHVLLV